MLFKFDEDVFRYVLQNSITDTQRTLIAKQGIKHPLDILLLQPKRYDVRKHDIYIKDLKPGTNMALIGRIRNISKRQIRRNLDCY